MAVADAAAMERVQRVEATLAAVGNLPEPERETALDALQAMLELYREGWARTVAHLHRQDEKLITPLADDALVGHILLLHGLHPRYDAANDPYDDDEPRSATVLHVGEARNPSLVQIATHYRNVAAPQKSPTDEDRCDLCGAELWAAHRHLVDLNLRALRCVCTACAILFDRREAAGGKYRLVPDRVALLEAFDLDEATWTGLQIPVDLAFFFRNSASGRVTAFYPGAMGVTESLLELEQWQAMEARNPVLLQMEADVEALLVNLVAGAQQHWLVPVDVCYALGGILRTHWKGLAGGPDAWSRIEDFFARLEERAHTGSLAIPM